MSNLRKWGIGMIAAGAAMVVVGGFAVFGKIPPAVVYTVYGVVSAGLVALGIVLPNQSLPQPPSG